MEHFNGILFHKSGPANKQHTNQQSNISKYKTKMFQTSQRSLSIKSEGLVET
jgi:hypothetical protein